MSLCENQHWMKTEKRQIFQQTIFLRAQVSQLNNDRSEAVLRFRSSQRKKKAYEV